MIIDRQQTSTQATQQGREGRRITHRRFRQRRRQLREERRRQLETKKKKCAKNVIPKASGRELKVPVPLLR